MEEKSLKPIPAIIVAAGSSTRMKGENKQFLSLLGKPVIARTLQRFEESEAISDIILVTKESDIENMYNICKEYGFLKVKNIVKGGSCRNESVVCGLKALPESEEKALIHDGARPFASSKIIRDCVLSLDEFDACLAAVSVTDTVKKANGNTVCETVDRSGLFLAQTPQGVNIKKYLGVCEKNDTSKFTDDASVMEFGGYKTAIITGSKYNIKITSPEDIPLARLYAEMQEDESNENR